MVFVLRSTVIMFVLICFSKFSYAQEGAPIIDNEMPVSAEELLIEEEEEEDENRISVFVNENSKIKELPLVEQMLHRVKIRSPEVLPSSLISSFLTYDETDLLRQARAGLIVALPTEGELDSGDVDESALAALDPAFEPGPRNVRLGGILYLSDTDWTVWLNGREVRPDAIPPTVLDLRVFKDYVELEWFDTQTNQIYPVRLRPNQTFNLDARLFLPG